MLCLDGSDCLSLCGNWLKWFDLVNLSGSYFKAGHKSCTFIQWLGSWQCIVFHCCNELDEYVCVITPALTKKPKNNAFHKYLYLFLIPHSPTVQSRMSLDMCVCNVRAGGLETGVRVCGKPCVTLFNLNRTSLAFEIER